MILKGVNSPPLNRNCCASAFCHPFPFVMVVAGNADHGQSCLGLHKINDVTSL